jgi:hypothetical protein
VPCEAEVCRAVKLLLLVFEQCFSNADARALQASHSCEVQGSGRTVQGRAGHRCKGNSSSHNPQ